MTINRSALSRKSTLDLLNKVKAAATEKASGSSKDDRFWQPTVDANGNGGATIRFLPSKTEEGLPFIKTYSHGFKVNGKWYIEECPTTIGLPCPVCERNNILWNSGFEDDKNVARERKRRTKYISNILVLKDPAAPQNEGKVFLYGYGQKIFDKLMTVMNPPAEYGDDPRDPFSFFDGSIMKMRISKVAGFRNFDNSVFEAAKDLYDGDEDRLMDLMEKMHDLGEFLDPKRFKPYAELERRLNALEGKAAVEVEEEFDADDNGTEYAPPPKPVAKPAPAVKKPEPKVEQTSDDEDDDDLAFFKSLAD